MKIVLLGAGGHAKSCIACLESAGYQIAGLLAGPEQIGQRFMGYEVLGGDEQIDSLAKAGYEFLVAVGHIETALVRQSLFERVLESGGQLPSIIAADSIVHRSAELGAGTLIMHRGFVNAGAKLGRNCIINTGAIVEHDVTIGDHVHVSTGAIVNGSVCIGDGSFIGSGAVIRNNLSIASQVVIGAGAVVVSSIVLPGTYVGNPARRLESLG